MKHFFTKNGLWVLAVAAVTSVLLLLISLYGISSPLQRVAGAVAYPIRAAYTAVDDHVKGLRKHYADYTALEEEVARLQTQVAELEAQVRQSAADREENVLLRELSGLQAQRRDLVLESADIVSRDSSNWTDALTVNRGSAQGVALGDCVINAGGALVGRVTEVAANWSVVLTLIDTDTELGAQIFRSGALAVAGGDFDLMRQGQLRLHYFSTDTHLMVGDLILTSGLGGYYPAQLPIGTVSAIQTDASGLTDYAVLTPAAALKELTQVFIIKDYAIVE